MSTLVPPAAAASLDSSILLRHLLNPSLPHLSCHFTLLPPRCPLFQPLHLLLPSSSQLQGKHLGEEPSPGSIPVPPTCRQLLCALIPWGEQQPPALSRQQLSCSARRLSLGISMAVTRLILRAAPLGCCCTLPDNHSSERSLLWPAVSD